MSAPPAIIASAPADSAAPGSPAAATPMVQFRTTALWVGDLARDVTEADLYRLFSAVAPVLSIRVCRDQVTSQSLGYAYVNYHTVEHAATAMTNLNFSELHGKRIRIAPSQRDPSRRRSNVGNIFIKNLPEEVDHSDLYSTFQQFGPILSCKVVYDPMTGISRRYGYVQFEKPEDAKKAIDSVNGMTLSGAVVSVEAYVPRSQRRAPDSWTNCYVKNIPADWDRDSLIALFSPFGTVTSAIVMTEAVPGQAAPKSRGFGFVDMGDHSAAEAAVAALNGKAVTAAHPDAAAADGAEATKVLTVCRAQSKSERRKELERQFSESGPSSAAQQTSNLYVKHLAEDVTTTILSEEFSKYGTVKSCSIMVNEDGTSRGFGFVTMSSAEEATRALNETHKKVFHGKVLYVAIHERRDIRQRKIQAFQMQMMRGQMPAYGGMMGQQQMGDFGVAFGAPAGYGGYPGMQGGGGFNAMGPSGMMGGNVGGFGRPAAPGGYPSQYGRGGGMGGGGGMGRGGRRGGAMGGGSAGPRYAGGAPGYSAGAYGGGGVSSRGPAQQPLGIIPAQTMPAPAPPVPQQRSPYESIDALPEAERMEFLGNKLYPLIHARTPEWAPKFTGMMLQLPTADVIGLIENPSMLSSKLDEAWKVLEAERAGAQ